MKKNILTIVVFTLGAIMIGTYFVAYLLPVTNQAKVSQATINVAANNVDGVVKQVLLNNGQNVSKDETVLILDNKSLNDRYDLAKIQYNENLSLVDTVKKRLNILNGNLTQANSQFKNLQILLNKDVDNGSHHSLEISSRIKAQQNIIIELQKQLNTLNKNLIQAKSQELVYANNLNHLQKNLENLIIKAPSSGYIQGLALNTGSNINNGDNLFSIVNQHDQKIIAYFSENDLSKLHENDEVIIFPRAYFGRHLEYGKIISSNWSLPNFSENIDVSYLIASPKRIPVEIKITSKVDDKHPLYSGMDVYVYSK